MGYLKTKFKRLLEKIEDRIEGDKEPETNDDRKVFAHYMVGLTCHQVVEQWAHDIKTAKEAGIDGFALNIGPSDPWTETQLSHAYHEAEEAGDFVLFISFDMACGEWSVEQVVGLINCFKESSAQFIVDGRPLVSTFEGPGWAENWISVREQTGDIFLVPDWSSLGPYGISEKLGIIDGAFSWDAWPKAGQNQMNINEDLLYCDNLKGKKYMMGVSPYFYTNLPQWNKNWYCSSESLWHDRWQQVLDVMPDFVQIITWNDFGESSYICDTVPAQVVEGAEEYVNGYSHAAFRAVLPYFIAAYKSGSRLVDFPGEDTVIAWYRTAPASAGEGCGTTWGEGGEIPASQGARDVISVMALVKVPTNITVAIGSRWKSVGTRTDSPLSYFEIPFDGSATGPVTLAMNGKTVEGPPISNECHEGRMHFNSVVIQT
ncbi:glycoside hydrolase [Apiosordaria backusii]|uniref:Glycoside hydrolase n=1 Tax=Apiosordaria backusii TaxID=314023 RepID=A0AA39ZSI2_9PEZI|nr:glycoside hydrolase [Apiosordaria backusii]